MTLKDYVASPTEPVETARWNIYILSYCLLPLKYISEEDSAFYSITLDKFRCFFSSKQSSAVLLYFM